MVFDAFLKTVIVCTEYFNLTGVSETPICCACPPNRGIMRHLSSLSALLERSGNSVIGANERLAHVKYPG